MQPNLTRAILALSCHVICIAGCEHSQTNNNSSQLSDQVETLTTRVEDLEDRGQQDLSPTDATTVLVDNANSEGVFTDATHVVAAGNNVLVYFATRNYASGTPSESTAQLCVYMNYYTAKRVLAAMTMSVQRHISVFGEVRPNEATGQPTTQDNTEVFYANFVRLNAGPEELILELGLNPEPVGIPTKPIPVAYAAIMDFHTASTFLRQISTLLIEYEAKNGLIETVIEKRVIN